MLSFHKFCLDNNIKLDTLSNFDIINYAKQLGIKNFRGVYMRDTLPKIIKTNESGIVNLEPESENGSHWICYFKKAKESYYFDSYGLDPCNELKTYLKGKRLNPVVCSTFEIQKFNTMICGQLSIYVLYYLERGEKFIDILLKLMSEIQRSKTGGDLNSDLGLVSNIAEIAEFLL